MRVAVCFCIVLTSYIVSSLRVGNYDIYHDVRTCSTSYHVPYGGTVVGEVEAVTSVECLVKCKLDSLCGSARFSENDRLCVKLDKTFLYCDQANGVWEKVCRFHNLIIIDINVIPAFNIKVL